MKTQIRKTPAYLKGLAETRARAVFWQSQEL